MCLIAREPSGSLLRAIQSVKPLVDEVCLLWTCGPHGSWAKPDGVDVVDTFDRCNAQKDCPPGSPCGCKRGDLLDFSAARSRSFALATGELRTYLDSDDTIEGEGDLRELYVPDVATYAPYNYGFDAKGCLTRRHYVPRVVDGRATWHYPVHNVLNPGGATSTRRVDTFTWVHHRTREGNVRSATRTLRMLLHWSYYPTYANDARFVYYLGRAFFDVGKLGRASEHMERALGLETNVDRKCLIALDLAQCYPPLYALPWAHKALELRPEWASPWCALARLYHRLDNKELSRRFFRGATECGPPDTPMEADPTDVERTALLIGQPVGLPSSAHVHTN